MTVIIQGMLDGLLVTQGYIPLTPIPPPTDVDNRNTPGIANSTRTLPGNDNRNQTLSGRLPN